MPGIYSYSLASKNMSVSCPLLAGWISGEGVGIPKSVSGVRATFIFSFWLWKNSLWGKKVPN